MEFSLFRCEFRPSQFFRMAAVLQFDQVRLIPGLQHAVDQTVQRADLLEQRRCANADRACPSSSAIGFE